MWGAGGCGAAMGRLWEWDEVWGRDGVWGRAELGMGQGVE